MDLITYGFCAGIVIASSVLRLVAGPFLIGKEAKIYTPGSYLMSTVVAIASIVVAGRAMGW